MRLDQIGKYKILEKIGQGAASTVYKGFDADLGRHVAVKVMSADAGGDETLRKRFEREAQSAARLAHPHIITVYDFGQEQDKLYMAMELLEGMDLKQAIVEQKLPTLEQQLEVMEQICEGLAFAHANEIIHRDLKPANIRLLADGQVKIMDFGLARQAGSDMTRTGLVMGTPYYMSPEQMRGEHVDARSDIFSLGCVFYELLTGAKPFDAESLHSVLYKVLKAEPRPAREVLPDLPVVVSQVLDRALAKDRTQRFADGGELLRGVQMAREAMASGLGGQPLVGLDSGGAKAAVPASPEARSPRADVGAGVPPSEASRSASAAAPRRPSRSMSAAASAIGRATAPTPRSRVPLYLIIGGLIAVGLVAAAAVVVMLVGNRGTSPAPKAPPNQIDELAKAVVATQIEVARKKLQLGDYDEALRQAERAQKLAVPGDPEVQQVIRDARQAKDRVEVAVREARAAAAGSDEDKKAEAYWGLLQAAPDSPVAGDLAGTLEPSFRARAEEAQRLMTAARQGAEKAQAARLSVFQEGVGQARAGEGALRERRFAVAAREFMRARMRFDRALRSVR
jgi:tRNA A-37 threonylcarbamoyl transferase component Bud32